MLITVPASSANLGPGFDSIGMAVNRYLTLEVSLSDEWSFHSSSPELKNIPQGKDNLIYEVADQIASQLGKTIPACHVSMESNIPLARGLGSSAAAIVAAIELVNQLCDLKLTSEEKVRYASLWEGHPDNVAPAVYGGLVVGTHTEERTDVVYCGIPEVDLVMLIPNVELKTKTSRSVLPEMLTHKEAVRASSVSNVLVAAILTNNWDLAGDMMMKDLLHQPYRMELVPGLREVMECVKDLGGYGAALSGAGPAIICFTKRGTGDDLQQKLQERFSQFSVERVEIAKEGVHIKNYFQVK